MDIPKIEGRFDLKFEPTATDHYKNYSDEALAIAYKKRMGVDLHLSYNVRLERPKIVEALVNYEAEIGRLKKVGLL